MGERVRYPDSREFDRFPSPLQVDHFIYVMDGDWYIESRSGEYGPFQNIRDAEQFAGTLPDEPSAKSH